MCGFGAGFGFVMIGLQNLQENGFRIVVPDARQYSRGLLADQPVKCLGLVLKVRNQERRISMLWQSILLLLLLN